MKSFFSTINSDRVQFCFPRGHTFSEELEAHLTIGAVCPTKTSLKFVSNITEWDDLFVEVYTLEPTDAVSLDFVYYSIKESEIQISFLRIECHLTASCICRALSNRAVRVKNRNFFQFVGRLIDSISSHEVDIHTRFSFDFVDDLFAQFKGWTLLPYVYQKVLEPMIRLGKDLVVEVKHCHGNNCTHPKQRNENTCGLDTTGRHCCDLI